MVSTRIVHIGRHLFWSSRSIRSWDTNQPSVELPSVIFNTATITNVGPVDVSIIVSWFSSYVIGKINETVVFGKCITLGDQRHRNILTICNQNWASCGSLNLISVGPPYVIRFPFPQRRTIQTNLDFEEHNRRGTENSAVVVRTMIFHKMSFHIRCLL